MKIKKGRGDRTAQMLRYRAKYPHKVMAQNHLNNAIRANKIVRSKTCQICGKETKTLAHHSDYSKFYDVIWVCWSWHNKIHELKKE